MKFIVEEQQRGLLFKNGKFIKMLTPGKHVFFGAGHKVELFQVKDVFAPSGCGLDVLLRDSALADSLEVVDVLDGTVALHYMDGHFRGALSAAKYAFWKSGRKHEFRHVSMAEPQIGADVAAYMFARIPERFYTKIDVPACYKACLCYDGVFIRLLDEGAYYFWNSGVKVDVYPVETSLLMIVEGQENLTFGKVDLRINVTLADAIEVVNLRINAALADAIEIVDVLDETVALHYTDGHFSNALPAGKHAVWKACGEHEFRHVSMAEPQIGADVAAYIFADMPEHLYTKIDVPACHKAYLCYDGVFVRLLDEGAYYFWNNGVKVDAYPVDTRLLQMNIQGQEILTLDKVAVRINFVCRYKITDYVKIHMEVADYEAQIHVLAQLALREYVGRFRLDELLESKAEVAGFVFGSLKAKEAELYVTFHDSGVKDIILPGEIREIMNTVLVAEKRAQANVITRREEVASTRSLLNTAKLMDENQTLLRLKELEYLEKICSNVSSVSVNGGGDLLGQLASMLKPA
ncbi:MAG: slipin family protein [Clostridiales Family XIII bacterium]|nr:slipin family protein [Clostridiales Family XIII bacterium]